MLDFLCFKALKALTITKKKSYKNQLVVPNIDTDKRYIDTLHSTR